MRLNRDGKLFLLAVLFYLVVFAILAITGTGCSPRQEGGRGDPPLQCLPGIVDGRYRVLRVVDGDTVIIDGLGPLRFSNIDAPKVGTPAGDAAKAELAARVEGKIVEIRFTRRKKASGQGSAGTVVRDRYGRLLGQILPPEK